MARISVYLNKAATTSVFNFNDVAGPASTGDYLTGVNSMATALSGVTAFSTGTIDPEVATLGTAITTAAGHAGVAFDSTADIAAISTAFNALSTDLPTLEAAAAAAEVSSAALDGAAADVVVSINTAHITTVSQLRAALNRILAQASGGLGGLAA